MEKNPKILSGWLTTNDGKIVIEARYATKYSILTVIKEKIEIKEILNLELQVGNNIVSIGPCKIILETDNQGEIIHIIPTAKFYNFEKLFYRSKIETLESASLSLPLLINYKNEIKPAFKDFVSNLTYDLSIYNYLLTQIDIATETEPREVKEYIQHTLIHGLGADLYEYIKTSSADLENLVSSFTDDEHEHHGFYFRRQLWHTLLQAPLMERTNVKPRGYNGDSEMMRMIYQNDYQGSSTFGKILHKYSVDQPAAQSVRNRRFEIAKKIRAFEAAYEINPDEKFRILSVACGPAMEIKDILKSKEECSRIHFSLLDQDQDALSEAASVINILERTFDEKVSYDIIRESVRIMLVNPDFVNRWGNFHFIYSMGLFDYFTTPVASAVLKKLYELLIPGCEMIIGNMHPSNPSKCYMEYWHDWRLIYRTEEELLELTSDLEGAECSVGFDETKIQMFLYVKKG